MENEKFKIGDLVKVKSGSPVFVVCNDKINESYEICCGTWSDTSQVMTYFWLDSRILVQVS